jgi:uncharacterized integral membrane protein
MARQSKKMATERCVYVVFANLYSNLVLNLLSVIAIKIMLIFLLENDDPLQMKYFGSMQTKQLFMRFVEYKQTLI